MNLIKSEALELARATSTVDFDSQKVEVCLFSPAVYFDSLSALSLANIELGAQNFYPAQNGAFTGEISLEHLNDFGIKNLLVGHSERRILFGETHEFLKQKVDAAIENGFRVFFCCGEPVKTREANKQNEFVAQQLHDSLLHLSADNLKKVVIAYEPVWAIGTGKTASNEQANEMHRFIRDLVASFHGSAVAQAIQILYGGSCNADNAAGLFNEPDIDGGLIGGASLKQIDFRTIIQAAQ